MLRDEHEVTLPMLRLEGAESARRVECTGKKGNRYGRRVLVKFERFAGGQIELTDIIGG